jgi:hypothetical protein
MLLHVHQGNEPKSEAFPPEVVEALAKIGVAAATETPSSRRMELRAKS